MSTDAESATGGEPTPAELRELQARADVLAADIAAMRRRLRSSGAPRSVRGSFPAAVDGALTQAAQRLGQAAEQLARVRASERPGSCTVRWGVCPQCGPTLRTEDGRSWCGECGAGWGYDRSHSPCGEQGEYLAMDGLGGTTLVCAAHGRYLQDRLDGGLLLSLPTL